MLYSDPIIITGPARSGTSLVAGIVHACGAWGGKITGPTPHNKKGQFENTRIRDNLVKPMLRRENLDPLCQRPLPTAQHLDKWAEMALEWRKAVMREVRQQGYKGGTWYYKGAKAVLMWTLWHAAFPGARWIYVRRNTNDIVASCLKTHFMRTYKDPEGWVGWVWAHLDRLSAMANENIDITIISPDDIISRNFVEIQRFVEREGLSWNGKKVRDFVTPELWGGKNGTKKW
jgi:hypothetical protein